MHGQSRAGCLAQGKRRARMVDMVMGEDHPVDRSRGVLVEKVKHGRKASRVAGIDDGNPFGGAMQVRLRAPDAGDPLDHPAIIGPIRFLREREPSRLLPVYPTYPL